MYKRVFKHIVHSKEKSPSNFSDRTVDIVDIATYDDSEDEDKDSASEEIENHDIAAAIVPPTNRNGKRPLKLKDMTQVDISENQINSTTRIYYECDICPGKRFSSNNVVLSSIYRVE